MCVVENRSQQQMGLIPPNNTILIDTNQISNLISRNNNFPAHCVFKLQAQYSYQLYLYFFHALCRKAPAKSFVRSNLSRYTSLFGQPQPHQEFSNDFFFLSSINELSNVIKNAIDLEQPYIKYFFVLQQQNLKYLVAVKDQSVEKMSIPKTSKLQVTRQTIKSLIIQALLLIEAFHRFGIRFVDDFRDYIQIVRKDTNKSFAEMVNLKPVIENSLRNRQQFLQLSQQLSSLSKTERQVFKQFLQNLLTQTGSQKYLNQIATQYRCFIEMLNLEQVKISELNQHLLNFQFQNQHFFYQASLNPNENTLSIRSQNNKNQLEFQTIISQTIDDSSGQSLSPLQLFCLISTQRTQKIKISQDEFIQLFDQTTKMVRRIDLSQVQQPKKVQDNSLQMQKLTLVGYNEARQQIIKCALKDAEYRQNSQIVEQSKPSSSQKQSKKPEIINQTIYPNNCLFQVISHFRKIANKQQSAGQNGQKPQVNTISTAGYGTLVAEHLIVTCAHNVFNSNFKYYQTTPFRVDVVCGDVVRKVTDYRFIQQYLSKDKTESMNNDVALLYLKRGVQLTKFIRIVIADSISKELISIPKKQGNRLVFNNQEVPQMQAENNNIIKYMIKTIKGESGSPIIISKDTALSVYYFIGIHTTGVFKMGQNDQRVHLNNQGVIFNHQIVKNLILLENQLIENKCQRKIQNTTIEFGKRNGLLNDIGQIAIDNFYSQQQRAKYYKIHNESINYYSPHANAKPIHANPEQEQIPDQECRYLLKHQFKEFLQKLKQIRQSTSQHKLRSLINYLSAGYQQKKGLNRQQQIIFYIYEDLVQIYKNRSDKNKMKRHLRSIYETVDAILIQQLIIFKLQLLFGQFLENYKKVGCGFCDIQREALRMN